MSRWLMFPLGLVIALFAGLFAFLLGLGAVKEFSDASLVQTAFMTLISAVFGIMAVYGVDICVRCFLNGESRTRWEAKSATFRLVALFVVSALFAVLSIVGMIAALVVPSFDASIGDGLKGLALSGALAAGSGKMLSLIHI